jgi:CubicO group peptidase (beta-lactamase class C family)
MTEPFDDARVARQRRMSAPVALLVASMAAADAPPDFTAVDMYVNTERVAQHIPGLALALVGPDGTIHVGGFGVTDPGGPVITSQTPFILGSTSKSFTALAVMQLVEAGRIELDAPVQRYLPWFAVADSQASAQITVRQLLNQTSGLSTVAGRRTLTDYSSGDDALENRVRALRHVALTAPVGTTYQYSNCNYQALGAIVQAASGMSFEAYLKTHVFEPLAMTHTYTSKAEAAANGLTIGHRSMFGRAFAFDEPLPRGSLPSGFIVSNAHDMAHYLSAQLNGGRWGDVSILSPEGIAELHRGAARIGDSDVYYAMGWNAGSIDGMPAVWHGGDTFGYQSYMILLTDAHWGAVMLANMNDISANGRFAEIAAGVLDLLVGLPPKRDHVHDSTVVHAIVFLIVAIQALGITRSSRLIGRWQREPDRRPRGSVAYALRIGLPSLVNLAWGALMIVVIPLTFAPLEIGLFGMPGLVHLLIASGAVALVWSALRAVLVLRAART